MEALDDDEEDASSYIGDLGALEDLRRAANGDAGGGSVKTKSVTIHPDVTEFHYPGNVLRCNRQTQILMLLGLHPDESQDGLSSIYESLPPPPPPMFAPDRVVDDKDEVKDVYSEQQQQQHGKGWLQKLSAPLVGASKPGMTKDEIIGFYCHQAGDVQL